MKTISISFLLANFFCWVLPAFAQNTSDPVSNVQWKLSDLEEDVLQITYDLAPSPYNSYYKVAFSVSLDGIQVTVNNAGGDIGDQITPGIGKRILWYYKKDVENINGNLVVGVQATRQYAPGDPLPCNVQSTKSIKFLLAGAGLAGLSMIAAGIAIESDSRSMYETYAAHLSPNDPIYQETSRDDQSDQSNQKHKTATALTVGGSVIVVAGSVYFINKLIRTNRSNKKCLEQISSVSPTHRLRQCVDLWSFTPASKGVGFGLAIHF